MKIEDRIYSNEFEQEYAELGLLREEPTKKRKLQHYFDAANCIWDREINNWDVMLKDGYGLFRGEGN